MWRVRGDQEAEYAYEAVSTSGEGNFYLSVEGGLVFLDSSQVEEVCDVCEEEPTADDPLGHFKDDEVEGRYVIAHGECGHDQGLELA